MTTRPATIHAQPGRVLNRLLTQAQAMASEMRTDLLPLYPDGELSSDQIDTLANTIISSLTNCLEIERILQSGLAVKRGQP